MSASLIGRLGSFCDISAALAEVRFVPISGPITRRQLTSASCHMRHSGDGAKEWDFPKAAAVGLRFCPDLAASVL
jgi:hypothetical protein